MQRLRLTLFYACPEHTPTVQGVAPQPSLKVAQERAMAWCDRPGRAATVWRPDEVIHPDGSTGTMRFRAWWDDRLQFIDY